MVKSEEGEKENRATVGSGRSAGGPLVVVNGKCQELQELTSLFDLNNGVSLLRCN